MSKESYAQYPPSIQVREFNVQGMVYMTTFLDAEAYPKQALRTLYKRRWDVELNLNSIKTVMEMDRLVCKTPEMVSKEIAVHFLAYNIIRKLMVEACAKHNALPWKTSFKGTLQLLNQFIPTLILTSREKRTFFYNNLLRLIVKNKVGNRPGRVEPRAVRHKTLSYPVLRNPRKEEQQKIVMQQTIIMDNNEAA